MTDHEPFQESPHHNSVAHLTTLFDARDGVARDPVLASDASTIWLGNRTTKTDYFHLWRMNVDGSGTRQVTDGPFHD